LPWALPKAGLSWPFRPEMHKTINQLKEKSFTVAVEQIETYGISLIPVRHFRPERPAKLCAMGKRK